MENVSTADQHGSDPLEQALGERRNGRAQAGKDSIMDVEPWQVRAHIYESFLQTGKAPAIEEIAQALETDERAVASAMRTLHVQHHLVIDSDGEVIAAHPFSNVPMPFDVSFDGVRTWGFCIWDSLGIAAMTGKDTVIDTSCGFCLHRIHLEVIRGRLTMEREYVAQFVIPAQRMWDDVKLTCSTQLGFCDENHAARWRERFHREPGSILSMPKTWALAKAWYTEDRRDASWRRRTVEEANALFKRLELPQPFWHVTEAT